MNKLNLTVRISTVSGFCSGVSRAISMAEEMLDRGEEVYCVGMIVHNEEEMKRLEAKGLKSITQDDLKSLKHKNVLFRAHGEPPASYRLALNNGNRLIDATCKVVLHIQDDIKTALERAESVVVFGSKDHPEVKGLLGQGEGTIIIIESIQEAEDMDLPDEISLFTQTTKSWNDFHALISILEKRGIEVKAHNTICRQVRRREEKLFHFSGGQDVMIFLAGKDSSNGKVLFDNCLAANARSYYISGIGEIKKDWFNPGENVGVAGATSTPLWLLEKVRAYLQSI
jgi:4-hydroxy-3-methylbut-2-enyl diphosphate reductase